MPFKSKAQRRKFAQLLVEGKISDETYEEWNRSTGRKELPERAAKKTGAKAKKAKRASKRGTAKTTPKSAKTASSRTLKRPATRRASKA